MRTSTPLLASALGIFFGLACGTSEDGASGDTTGDAGACEHGTSSPCACTDGRMGVQMCAHDSSGFEACECDGDTGEPPAGTTTGDPPPGTSTADDAPQTTGEGDESTTASLDDSTGSSSDESGPIGQAPEASILHPSDGEERVADMPIPFIGEAADLEDGTLSGASMLWASDVEGPIGQGEMFDAPLSTLGDHVITLTATDADGNSTETSLTLTIIAP